MSKAEELANSLENLEATGWGGDCFALTEFSQKQADMAAAELRRLAQVEAEHAALLKAISDAEPVAWMNPEDGIDATTSFRWIQIGDFTQPLYTLNGIKP